MENARHPVARRTDDFLQGVDGKGMPWWECFICRTVTRGNSLGTAWEQPYGGMMKGADEQPELELDIHRVEIADELPEHRILRLMTNRGQIFGRYYGRPDCEAGVIWVGGTGGGFDSPAGGLYDQVPPRLLEKGVSSLRIRFREPGNLDECVLDVMAGMRVLESEGVSALGLVGYSFGGAVIIQAASTTPLVRSLVTLATQSYATDTIDRFPPGGAILTIHGKQDEALPWQGSQDLYDRAYRQERTLLLYEEGSHTLDEVAGDIERQVTHWLLRTLPHRENTGHHHPANHPPP